MSNSIRKNYLHVSTRILFLFCFFMYTPTLKGLPTIAMMLITYGIPFIYIIFNRGVFRKLRFNQYIIVLSATLLFVLSLLSIVLHETGDYSYLSITTYFFRKGLIYLFLICVIIKNTNKNDKVLHYFLYYFALTHVIYVIGTLILVLIPAMQDVWFSVFVKDAIKDSLFESYGYTFRLGWQGFAGFRLTLYCTISIIFTLFLRYNHGFRAISAKQFLVLFIGCFMGNMFYGRSGIIVSAIVAAIAIVVWNRKNIRRVLLFCSIPVFVILAVNTLRQIPIFSQWYEWMATPFVNLITTGEMNNASFSRLQEMSRMEIPEESMLFGDGYYNIDGHYYMRTDVGYSRNILFWGLIGAFLSYALTIYSIASVKRVSILMVVQLFVVFFIFEYKGAVYYEFIPLSFAINMTTNYMANFEKRHLVLQEDVE